jgi:hypothetical protein
MSQVSICPCASRVWDGSVAGPPDGPVLCNPLEVRLQDYRELDADRVFDAVRSIEMGEHVGEEHYPAYVDTMYRALRPGGEQLLQQMSRRAGAAPGGRPAIEACPTGYAHAPAVADAEVSAGRGIRGPRR